MNDILVSVIMPVYNREAYLAEAITSIINQTYENWELIVIDDKSNDNSLEIANQLASQDKRIKVLVNETNLGVSTCRNIGIGCSQGCYIAFLDSDDIALTFRLASQVDLLMKGFDLVGSSIMFIDEKGKQLNSLFAATTSQEMTKIMKWSLPVFNPTLMTKREVIERIGNYRLPVAEDYDFFLRAWDNGLRIGNLADIAVYVRLHPDNVSVKKVSMMRFYTKLAWKLHKERVDYNKELSNLKPIDEVNDPCLSRTAAYYYRLAAISPKLSIRFWLSFVISIILWPPNLVRIIRKVIYA